MLTEQEARERWCPFVRVGTIGAGQPVPAFNRPLSVPHLPDEMPTMVCVGSTCMAWRWASKKNPDWVPRASWEVAFPRHPADEQPQYIPDTERGYCGLAGRVWP